MRLIDMTHDIEAGMPTFNAPWHAKPEFHQMGTIGKVGRNTSAFMLGSHTGTHIDAPLHFVSNGAGIDSVPIDILCGEITVVDLRESPECYEVTVEDLSDRLITERMLFVFGWDKQWKTEMFYKNYPYFSKKAAEYLVERGVKLLAIDTPSPDDSRIPLLSERDSEIHKIFLSNSIVLVEYLANTSGLDFEKKHKIYALPLKVLGRDGSPARVVLCEY